MTTQPSSLSSCYRPMLIVACLLCLALLWPRWAAAEDKKEPDKQQDAKEEEQNLKKALEHLREYANLVRKLQEAKSREQCANNLKQIGLALHNYQDTGWLPPATWPGQGQHPNWAYYLLPYMEQNNLYGQNRLGVVLEPVSETLAGHLDIPRGQGMVIGQVLPNSAAAKAGLQAQDILLQLNGKAVSRDSSEFSKVLQTIEAKKPVEAIVLRKGKKTTIKGISLPQASATWPGPLYLTPSAIRDGTSNTIIIGERPNATPPGPASSPILTTTHRQEDRFTTRYQEGSLIITLTGTIQKDRVVVGEIKVQDGNVTQRHASLEKVPREYQDKARELIEVSEKGQGKIEIRKP